MLLTITSLFEESLRRKKMFRISFIDQDTFAFSHNCAYKIKLIRELATLSTKLLCNILVPYLPITIWEYYWRFLKFKKSFNEINKWNSRLYHLSRYHEIQTLYYISSKPPRWQCLVYYGTLKTLTWSKIWKKKCLYLGVSSLSFTDEKCASHFCRETANENKQLKETKSLISHFYLIRQSFQGHQCKSGIGKFAWRFTWNQAQSPFKLCGENVRHCKLKRRRLLQLWGRQIFWYILRYIEIHIKIYWDTY